MKPGTLDLAALREEVTQLQHASARHAQFAAALTGQGFRQDAIEALRAASALPHGRAEDHEALAYAAFTLDEHELSRAHYERVVKVAPNDPTAWYNLASSERNVGRLQEAEAACDRAIALQPYHAQALLLRSHLRVQRPDRNHVEQLRRTLSSLPARAPQAILLHYALGKELDDLGRYDEAFDHFAMGASARRQTLQYDVGTDVQKLQRIRQVFNTDALAAYRQCAARPRFGFIIGLPRSGTTLIERVLTGNPLVQANGETENLLGALMDGTPAEGGDIFERVARADPALVAPSYERRAGKPPPGGVILEKLPLNYLYAGAVARTLRDAQLLLLRRNPVDNCFAMFSTLFGSGYPFSYSLADLAAYVIEYDKLMRHWKESLGERLLEVSYDDFVVNPTAVGPALAAHFSVSWSEDMVAVEKNKLATATASAAQVRRPIYSSASGRWRTYERHLRPLIDALAEAGMI